MSRLSLIIVTVFSAPRASRQRGMDRGGDRAANSAIHIIAIGRLRLDPRSQGYVAKRIAAGHSKLEGKRCPDHTVAA